MFSSILRSVSIIFNIVVSAKAASAIVIAAGMSSFLLKAIVFLIISNVLSIVFDKVLDLIAPIDENVAAV